MVVLLLLLFVVAAAAAAIVVVVGVVVRFRVGVFALCVIARCALAILLIGDVDKLFAEFKAITLEAVDDEYRDHAQELQCVALVLSVSGGLFSSLSSSAVSEGPEEHERKRAWVGIYPEQ